MIVQMVLTVEVTDEAKLRAFAAMRGAVNPFTGSATHSQLPIVVIEAVTSVLELGALGPLPGWHAYGLRAYGPQHVMEQMPLRPEPD
jgi:hypothetical protein